MTSDEELMVQYRGGSEAAFGELYRRHGGRVYGYLLHRTQDPVAADDLLQLAFMKLHKSRENYDPALPFLPWLFWICKTVWLDHLRKAKGEARVSPLDLEPEVASTQGLDPSKQDHTLEKLPQALGQLRTKEKEALDLRYEQELPFDEIAKRFGTSQVSARKRVNRAVQALRSLLIKGAGAPKQGKVEREQK